MKAQNQKWYEKMKIQSLLLLLSALTSHSGLNAQSPVHPWHIVDNGGAIGAQSALTVFTYPNCGFFRMVKTIHFFPLSSLLVSLRTYLPLHRGMSKHGLHFIRCGFARITEIDFMMPAVWSGNVIF